MLFTKIISKEQSNMPISKSMTEVHVPISAISSTIPGSNSRSRRHRLILASLHFLCCTFTWLLITSPPTVDARIIPTSVIKTLTRIPRRGGSVTLRRGRDRGEVRSVERISELVVSKDDITPYIQQILNQRLDQVMSGQRKSTFSKFHKSSRLNIVSTHGRNGDECENGNGNANQGDELDACTVLEEYEGSSSNAKQNDQVSVFPKEITSLDLSLPPKIHNVATTEIARRIKSEVQENHEGTSKFLYGPKLFVRAMKLGVIFAPISMTFGLALCSQKFRDNYWFDMVGSCLARSGPAFIKWGQWASTRSDMFPDRFCEALSQLHADAPAHSWKITQTTVEEALCIPKGCLHDVFQEFDEEPVASGSIAQIHRAILKPLNSHAQSNLNANEKDDDDNNANTEKGSLVAVKVRHPNVAQLIDMDFRLMSMIAALIDCFPALRWLRIKSSIEQFSHTMAAQAYLNIEAHHLEVLNHNFRKWDYVDFPQPIFACSKVIIETFEEGKICTTMIEQYDRLAGDIGLNAGDVMPVPLAKFIVTTGVALYLKMLIIDNLMHADLHPGNIMVLVELFNQEDAIASALNPTDELSKKHAMKMARAEVTAGFYGHITMVDAGMVAQLEDDESDNFIGLLSSMGAGDGRTAALAVLNFSDETGYLSAEQEKAFIEDMMDYFDKSCRGYGTNVDVGEVLRGVLGLIKTHHVRVGANYATLVVNALCIEGLAKQVCPTYNVLDAAKPLLNSYRTLPLFKSKSKVLKSFVLKYITPFLYFQKDIYDRKFFKKVAAERRRRRHSFLQNLSRWVSKCMIVAATTATTLQILKSDDVGVLLELVGKKSSKQTNGIDNEKEEGRNTLWR